MSTQVLEVATPPVVWFSGPARLEGEAIAIDSGALTQYSPLTKPNLPYDLAGIQKPVEAVEFVQEYGLLRDKEGESSDSAPIDRQPFEEFERAARWLRELIDTKDTIDKAVEGDRPATARLRKWAMDSPHPWSYHWRTYLGADYYKRLEGPLDFFTAARWKPSGNHQDFLRGAARWIAEAVTSTTGSARLVMVSGTSEDEPPNAYKHAVVTGRSLMQIAALMLEQDFINSVPLKRCAAWPLCSAYVRNNEFGRKAKWHSKTCGARNRKQKQRAGGR
jgi:hypothetical protein